MSDLEDFLAHTLQRHAQATTGVRNGDATALIEMLSTRDPVTLFPAAQPAKRGWAEVSQAFQRVASLYSNSTPVTFDLVAAGVSGDLAYVVGYERGSVSVGGGPGRAGRPPRHPGLPPRGRRMEAGAPAW